MSKLQGYILGYAISSMSFLAAYAITHPIMVLVFVLLFILGLVTVQHG